ncbi:WG repeat-containing protein [Urechidicola croceus]|uniref:WG repeat-containing protein n=1 Tax=Urechidicola croceus TaxID=1850246 RepID=A0A1D8P7Z0_9FLAO|nr:WG repeat-containing protein [Urechidicola croceus]AOW20678.1 hypothetical protein LPB138_08315 [Urechidicola croceus]
MKKAVNLLVFLILLPTLGFTQSTNEFDFISPFHEGYASIKNGEKWAFIDKNGTITINYRDDLVPITIDNENYPLFKNERCLIDQVINDVTYFGYINPSGNIVIKPQYINATKFEYEKAIVIKLITQNLGYNNVLNKPVVTYKFQEVVIDKNGNELEHLTELTPITLGRNIPKIKSKLISENLIATIGENNKWHIKKI